MATISTIRQHTKVFWLGDLQTLNIYIKTMLNYMLLVL